MKINRATAVLIVLVVVLLGAVAFLLGQRSADDEEPSPAANAGGMISSRDLDPPEEPTTVAATQALAVRIGRDGPDAGACDRIGRVANLPGGEDDFLSVREAPTTDAQEIDRLGDDLPLFVCDRQGAWFGVVYPGDGTLGDGDACGLFDPVGSPRAYSGPCLTGWVASRYVDASGAQDSDEPYTEGEESDATSQIRTVQVSATGPSQAVAAMRMAAKAESDFGKPVDQRPDGNRVACRETGTGDAAWTCAATYTLAN